ncbi:hypothetical protein BG015_006340 [Linnemannia schmuckeri]|uniref:FHA domain-containing protein n=1 Tax=Linnemannia schmuckeri TaxID=64567 RepID=A0A9P5VBV5_9FUNG|nr:hypothetical protein BG015_006340 [Linnemannia schmuckeri]
MLFQPPLPDSDPEPLSPSSHEDTTRPSWSHAILAEPSYRPLLLNTTQQQQQRQATGSSDRGSGSAYRAPSSSSSAYSPISNVEFEYVDTLTATRQVSSGSRSLSTDSSQYGYGLYDEDEDEDEEDEVEDEEDTERFTVAAQEIEEMEEEYVRQQQQQQQQHLVIEDDDEEESKLNTLYPVTEPFKEAVPAGVESGDEEEAQTLVVPETTYTTRTTPFVHLEIQELRASQSNSDHEQQHRLTGTLPRPRQFIFEPNTRLLLGRAPSSGLDPKARLKQLSEVGKDAGQARAENGYDDGLFANQVISKLHAAIFERDGQLVLEDWESTHGTFVNEESISRKTLHDLDHVRLGRPVTRRDIHYKPLEFVVRIQSREHYEHPSARADPADLITHSLDNSPGTSTPQSQKTVILVDDDIDEEERADLLACSQTQAESLDVQEPLERTPTDEQETQEAQYEDNAFQEMENDYEADEDEPDADYDDDSAFEQHEDDYEEQQPEFEDEDVAVEQQQHEDHFLTDEDELAACNQQRKQREEYDVDDDEEEEVSYRKATDYELDDDEDEALLTHPDLAHSDLTQVINSAAVHDAIEDDEDLPIMGESVIKETSLTSTTSTTVTIATASPTDAVVEKGPSNHLKRKYAELEDEPPVQLNTIQQEAQTLKSRKTALFVAALAGVVVGSVGTVLTLANI